MYRIPTDDIRYGDWCEAIRPHVDPPMKGLICMNHFNEDDLVSTARGICLKKNAIPRIFQNEKDGRHENGVNHRIDEIDQIDSEISQTCDTTEINSDSMNIINIMKAENESLLKDFAEFRAEKNVLVEKLEHRVDQLEQKIGVQKDHIKYLNTKLYRQEKTKETLKKLLKDLEQQNMLTKSAVESLEVSLFNILLDTAFS